MSMDKDIVVKVMTDVYANSTFEWISQPAVDNIIANVPEEYKKLVFDMVGAEFANKPISEWSDIDHKNMGILSMYDYLDNY